jgi:predicted nucleotidyltransferase
MASEATDYRVEDIVAVVDTPDTIGIALVGSLARGTATRWSDMDVHRYVNDGASRPPNIVRWVAGRLLRANTTTPREVREELARPETAVWAVEPTRTMRILVDREGQLALIKSAALAFEWSRIAEAANEWVSQRVSKDAENVLKLRGAVDARDESSVLNAHVNLALHCTEATCVALGVLITSENRFHEQVREAAGPTWTTAQRAAYGLEGGDIFARAVATCALYEATVTLLSDHLDSPARQVAERAIAVMPR